MKPSKECVEWFNKLGWEYIIDIDLDDSYFHKDLTENGIEDCDEIDIKQAQEIYNQVQKEKVKTLNDVLYYFVSGLPTGEIEAWKLLGYCNQFTKKVKQQIGELRNETK